MARNRLDIDSIRSLSDPPKLFDDSGPSIWTDPYISKHVLHAHLDPHIDDASRKAETIRSSCDWIAGLFDGPNGLTALDLGCGPGLYCVELAKHGFDVTGVDYSRRAISHGRKLARREHVKVGFVLGDFRNQVFDKRLEAAPDVPVDLVAMVYGTFGVMSDTDRDAVLKRVRSLLRPGGLFVFDVFTKRYVDTQAVENGWYVRSKNGFWHPRPHLVLEKSIPYPEHDVHLNLYIVVPENEDPVAYRMWYHYYTRTGIEDLLSARGFQVKSIHSDLCGTPYKEDGAWIGVVCTPR